MIAAVSPCSSAARASSPRASPPRARPVMRRSAAIRAGPSRPHDASTLQVVVPAAGHGYSTTVCHPQGWAGRRPSSRRQPAGHDDRPTSATVSMTPATPVETTGEIVLNWGPGGPVVTAPERAAIPAVELFGMRRVPGKPRAVELPGGVRYRIGAAHRRWPGAVYLHRLPQ